MSFSFSVLFFLYSISTKLHAEAEEIGSYSNPATSTESVKRDPHKKNAPSKKAKKKSKCFVCFINIEPEKKICADCATLENDKIFRIARK